MRTTVAPTALVDLVTATDLLEQAVRLLQGTLEPVGPGDLARSTPCERWDVALLLAHLEDAVGAFTEAATGEVPVHPVRIADAVPHPRALAVAAGALPSLWRTASLDATELDAGGADDVRVGGAPMGAAVLVGAAALELAVHADDLGSAIGGPLIDDALALALWPVARALVRTGDRAGRFDAPREVVPGAAPRAVLRAHLGRRPG